VGFIDTQQSEVVEKWKLHTLRAGTHDRQNGKELEKRRSLMKYGEKLLGWFVIGILASATLLFPLSALAGGVNHEPLGAEAFLAGILPPPGFYVKEYLNYYTADKLKDNGGRTLSLSRDGTALDKLEVYASSTRFLYISPVNILGGSLGAQMIIPWVRTSLKLDASTPGGLSEMGEHRNAIGDVTLGPNLSWHSKNGLFHAATGLDITAPMGPWNERHLVNVGANVWSFSPVLAATVFFPWHPNLSAGVKMDYSFSTRNDDFILSPSTAAKIGNVGFTGLETHLLPGQEFHFDYGIEYALTKTGAAHQFRIGAFGYFYQQTTEDKTGEGRVRHDLGRVFAIGPGAWWTYKKWVVEAHTAFEMAVRNRPEGINSYLTIVHTF